MMKNKLFGGIIPAVITPVGEDGRLLAGAAEAVLKHCLREPVTGFYINGATGEGPILPEAVRREMAEIAVGASAGKAAVINHIGAPDVKSALALAKHSGEIGCAAVSSLPPNYLFQYPADRVLDYYRRVADVSGLPVIVYANTRLNTEPVGFMEKAMEIPGVAGVKYTMPDYYDLHRLCEINGGDINVLNGPDETLICGLVMGADGGIGTTYNVMPGWFCELYRLFTAGDITGAREIQYKINRMITVLRRYSSVPAVKQYYRFVGIEAGDAAYPARVFTRDESNALRLELRAAGVPEV